jgi:hypothetical protein
VKLLEIFDAGAAGSVTSSRAQAVNRS